MSKIILNVDDDDGIIKGVDTEGTVKLSFDDVLSFCMSFMESACKDYVKHHKEADATDLYDTVDYLFFKFMERVFPDIQPRDFDLSDAGLLYAQDQIIEEAVKNDMSYEEALKKYEDKAKEYVKEKARLMA